MRGEILEKEEIVIAWIRLIKILLSLLILLTTVVPEHARANSQQLLTILEMRGEILEKVESDNMDQIDPAEFADVTLV
jgi:hypothetical protein